ncbi:MAG TPA: Asp23/Gls24 family envelope stress response protein [Anaerolineaceae bacterium]|nr:Asp23/Gls24 family envelope stress response protein [Anaerolineaceae bacterium]
MNTTEELLGKTTIDPNVILTIIRMTALRVSGVCRMASGPAGLDDLVKKYYSDGVKIDVEDHTVYIDLYLVLYRDVDLRATARKIQKDVQRAVEDMVGMSVASVDIHIDDIVIRNNTKETA